MYCGKYSPVLVPVMLIKGGGIRNIKSICMKEYFMHLFSKKMYAIILLSSLSLCKGYWFAIRL